MYNQYTRVIRIPEGRGRKVPVGETNKVAIQGAEQQKQSKAFDAQMLNALSTLNMHFPGSRNTFTIFKTNWSKFIQILRAVHPIAVKMPIRPKLVGLFGTTDGSVLGLEPLAEQVQVQPLQVDRISHGMSWP